MRRFGYANVITVARIMLIPLFLVALLGEWARFLSAPQWWNAAKPWIAAGIFIGLAATDALDGWVARARGEVTTFGALVDPLADKLLVTAALFALVDLDRLPAWIAIIIVSREFIVTGLRMVAVAEGRVVAASEYGKAKTVLQIVAIVAFILKDSPALHGFMEPRWVAWFGIGAWIAMGVALLATVASMIDYFLLAGHVISGPWTKGPAQGIEPGDATGTDERP